MWAYFTNGLEPAQVTELEEAYDGVSAPEAPSGGRNVGTLLAGMKGG